MLENMEPDTEPTETSTDDSELSYGEILAPEGADGERVWCHACGRSASACQISLGPELVATPTVGTQL